MTKGPDLLAAALESESVEKNVDVIESLHGSKRQAGFVAETYGRLTGKPGIYISTLGPGTLNFCFISKVPS
jgi:thiamine pyrophosphate-dependent acetolactate synthase large subunit-like protein